MLISGLQKRLILKLLKKAFQMSRKNSLIVGHIYVVILSDRSCEVQIRKQAMNRLTVIDSSKLNRRILAVL